MSVRSRGNAPSSQCPRGPGSVRGVVMGYAYAGSILHATVFGGMCVAKPLSGNVLRGAPGSSAVMQIMHVMHKSVQTLAPVERFPFLIFWGSPMQTDSRK